MMPIFSSHHSSLNLILRVQFLSNFKTIVSFILMGLNFDHAVAMCEPAPEKEWHYLSTSKHIWSGLCLRLTAGCLSRLSSFNTGKRNQTLSFRWMGEGEVGVGRNAGCFQLRSTSGSVPLPASEALVKNNWVWQADVLLRRFLIRNVFFQEQTSQWQNNLRCFYSIHC